MNSSNNINNEGIVRLEKDSGELKWINDTYELFGISSSHSMPVLETFLGHVHNDDREITKRAISLACELNISNVFNFRFINPLTGAELFIHSIWDVERDGNGDVTEVKGRLVDVTKKGIVSRQL